MKNDKPEVLKLVEQQTKKTYGERKDGKAHIKVHVKEGT